MIKYYTYIIIGGYLRSKTKTRAGIRKVIGKNSKPIVVAEQILEGVCRDISEKSIEDRSGFVEKEKYKNNKNGKGHHIKSFKL